MRRWSPRTGDTPRPSGCKRRGSAMAQRRIRGSVPPMRDRFSWRVVKTVTTLGFRAHRGLMTGSVLTSVVAGVAGGLTPLGIKWFVDGAAATDRSLLVRGAVTLTLGAAGTYAAMMA